MKKYIIPIIFIGLLIFVGCSTQESNKKENISVAITKSDNLIEAINSQMEDILNEKEYIRENKPQIEYLQLTPEAVEIPILMYHSISDADINNNLLVPPDMFEEQVKWLYDNGFTPMIMPEVLEAMETGKVPKRPVAITFDDGYADNYNEAYQILKKYKMKATFFIITDVVDVNPYYMSSEMLKEMNNTGMDIENHTSNHLELNKLSKEDQISSIKNAQDFLREVVGVDSKYLCYPVGRYNETTIEVDKELGINAAVTTNGGIAKIDNGQYTLDRVRIGPMDIESFASIFSDFMSN